MEILRKEINDVEIRKADKKEALDTKQKQQQALD